MAMVNVILEAMLTKVQYEMMMRVQSLCLFIFCPLKFVFFQPHVLSQ